MTTQVLSYCQVFQNETAHAPLISFLRNTRIAYPIPIDLESVIIFRAGGNYKL
jgi:hypothetical protein